MSLKKKIKSKWFIGINIFIFLLLLIIININTIINMFGGDYQQEKVIKIIDNIDEYDKIAKSINKGSKYYTTKIRVEKMDYLEEEEIEKLIKKDSNIIVLLVDNDLDNYIKATLVSNTRVNSFVKSNISGALNSIRYERALKDVNLSQDEMSKVNANVKIIDKVLIDESSKEKNNNKDDNSDIMGVVAVIIFTMPFFFLITTLVQMIGAEINEEKSTKSMEIIISNVSPKDHLIAKIISCTLFTLIQIGTLALFMFIAILIRNKTGVQIQSNNNQLMNEIIKQIISPSIVKSMIKILPLLIIFLIFTLITYSIVAGVLASMTTNIDDFQQLQTPIMLTISIGFYLSILASIFEGSTFIKIMSYVPLVSFMLSPSLFMLQQVSLASVIISTIIQIIFTFLVYKYGMKVYKVGILNYSGNHLWKKIWQAITS